MTTPRAAIPNARPVRSCESLASVALPDTTSETAAIDPANPEICRVTAVTTHPPVGDRVRIWVTIPTTAWNGRFLGTGGGGFSDQSVEQYGIVFGTDDPDLSAFRDHGGKAIVWHGWSDGLISAEGMVDYYRRVQHEMGGAMEASEFIRLFMAPGVGHCGGGAGPEPTATLEALLAWVEDGNAPDTLLATRRDPAGAPRTRPLCQYPQVARYNGSGSTDDASNLSSSDGF